MASLVWSEGDEAWCLRDSSKVIACALVRDILCSAND